ncbi:MAG: glycosyltransferase family 4 protein, partial [bacterium]|nr:glycosyltransferase family 4 protein [bacterium]
YLSAAKPILFSIECDYNPVEDAQSGITLPPGNPEALAAAIIRLYEMPQQERKEMGEKGRAYAKEYHDMEKLADKFQQLLTELKEEKRS